MAKNAFNLVSFIFPCFNEQENLARFDQEVFRYFDDQGLNFECVLVDDGSADGTWAAAQALARAHPGVDLVRHEANRGLGAAVRSGIAAASGDSIVTMDSDLTFSPGEAMKLFPAYGTDVDCVIGSPQAGEFKDIPFIRRVLSDGVNRIYSFLLSQPITATSSILRLYRSSLLKDLALQSTGFDINAEIIFRLLKQGARVKEVPVVLTARTLGYSKIRTFLEIRNHLKMFLRITRWKFAG